MRTIDKIIIHCSATPENRNVTIEEIDRYHRQRGFRCVGYHFVIYLDGSVHVGRPIEQVGAHCLGQNAHSIGICYIGGMTTDGNTIKDTRTKAQKDSLVRLITELRQHFPNASVHGHREFANRACPCFNASAEYANL